jgi:DNA polymerase delta subunit 2
VSHSAETLTACSQNDFPSQNRTASSYNPLDTFVLPKGEEKHYAQQFADMYFLRLAMLKPDIEKIALDAWKDFQVKLFGSRHPRKELIQFATVG